MVLFLRELRFGLDAASPKAVSYGLTDLWLTVNDVPEGAHGCVATIIVGYVALQVLTVVPTPENRNAPVRFNSKIGTWNRTLISLWPPADGTIGWPPPISFNIGHPDEDSLSVYHLFDRWRIGQYGRP